MNPATRTLFAISLIVGSGVLPCTAIAQTFTQTFTVSLTGLPLDIPNPGSVSRDLTFGSRGAIVAMELYFEFDTRCENNHSATLRDPGGKTVLVMDRGLNRCSGVIETYSSTNSTVGDAFRGREAEGAWTFTMSDLDEDSYSASLEEVTLVITVEPPDSPLCDVELNQATYAAGDSVIANRFRLANPGPDAVAVEWKLWLAIPNIPAITIVNAGADGSLVLPPGFDTDSGPVPLFPIGATTPVGQYEFGCRFLDPVTGETTSLDSIPFEVIGQP